VEWLTVTLSLYGRAFARAGKLALRNSPVLGTVFAYAAIMTVAGYFAVFLGLAGGFLLSIVWAACVGSFLYLVEMIVRTSRVTWEDFRRSFGMYLWDVVGVTFVLWIFWQIAMPILRPLPQGGIIALCIEIAIFIFFNAVPELIYLGHNTLLSLLSESYRFIADNWIEWFPPNVLFAVCLLALWRLPAADFVAQLLMVGATALFVYFAMVARGLMFLELSGTSRRGRAFRHRMGR
jgi:hypothetical protein